MHKLQLQNDNFVESLSQPAMEDSIYHGVSMRRFIRHPSSVPISFDVVECGRVAASSELINVSRGGLCFHSEVPIPEGANIQLKISIDKPPFEASGQVAWCRSDDETFIIGVAFNDGDVAYSVRMVEQVCYIEHYRRWVLQGEGRELTSEQAAKEWIEQYAKDFPKH